MADHTYQLSEETSRDAPVDVYADVKKVDQNTSITTEFDRISKIGNGVR
ncbi:MAG TPA: hypothetical protein VH500_12335 [Nitrososphaeraceae archaeon]